MAILKDRGLEVLMVLIVLQMLPTMASVLPKTQAPKLTASVRKIGDTCNDQLRCEEPGICESMPQNIPFPSVCECPRGTLFVNGTCIQLAAHGQECKTPSDCDSASNVFCLNGTCQCAEANQTFHSEYKRCMSNLGGPCRHNHDDSTNCIPNAICNWSGRCSCAHAATRSTFAGEPVCLSKQRGSKCNLKDKFLQCDPSPPAHLECIEGFCACRGDSIWINVVHGSSFDFLGFEDYSACRIKAGYSCREHEGKDVFTLRRDVFTKKTVLTSSICIQHAICIAGECRCRDGYSQTANGSCALSHAQTCKNEEYERECNPDLGLICTNGTCDCAESNFDFNPTTLSCEDPEIEISPDERELSGTHSDQIDNHRCEYMTALISVNVIVVLIVIVLAILFFKMYNIHIFRKI